MLLNNQEYSGTLYVGLLDIAKNELKHTDYKRAKTSAVDWCKTTCCGSIHNTRQIIFPIETKYLRTVHYLALYNKPKGGKLLAIDHLANSADVYCCSINITFV